MLFEEGNKRKETKGEMHIFFLFLKSVIVLAILETIAQAASVEKVN